MVIQSEVAQLRGLAEESGAARNKVARLTILTVYNGSKSIPYGVVADSQQVSCRDSTPLKGIWGGGGLFD